MLGAWTHPTSASTISELDDDLGTCAAGRLPLPGLGDRVERVGRHVEADAPVARVLAQLPVPARDYVARRHEHGQAEDVRHLPAYPRRLERRGGARRLAELDDAYAGRG